MWASEEFGPFPPSNCITSQGMVGHEGVPLRCKDNRAPAKEVPGFGAYYIKVRHGALLHRHWRHPSPPRSQF